jgi:hypothetical protein
MTVPVFGPDRSRFPRPTVAAGDTSDAALFERADYVVIDSSCAKWSDAQVRSKGFDHVANRKPGRGGQRASWKLYLKK